MRVSITKILAIGIGAVAWIGCSAAPPPDDSESQGGEALTAGGGTVGAPTADCWVPQSETWEQVGGACVNGICEEALAAGLGVCYNGTVMIPILLAPNGVCLRNVPGQLPGSALTIPSHYYDPSNPYEPPVCTAPPPVIITPRPVPTIIRPPCGIVNGRLRPCPL